MIYKLITLVALLITLASAQQDCSVTPDVTVKLPNNPCSGYNIYPNYIVVSNFNQFSSIVVSPLPIERFYSDGQLYIHASNGTNAVTFTMPNGCVQTKEYTFALAQLVVSSQPQCQYSVVDGTFMSPQMFATYTIDGSTSVNTATQPIKMSAGYTQVNAKTPGGKICRLATTLVPLSPATPSIKVIHNHCDGSTIGTITVANPQSYTKISLHLDSSNNDISQPSGIFTSLPTSTYTLTLQSAACGTEIVTGSILTIQPTIDLYATPFPTTCFSGKVNISASIENKPLAVFTVNGAESQPQSTFLVNPDSSNTITYKSGNCFVDQLQFNTPRTATDVSYSISSKPTCANPTATVTVYSVNQEYLTVSNGDSTSPLTNGNQFTAEYGTNYFINDTCYHGIFNIQFPRTIPIYTVDMTTPYCTGIWTITVHNYEEFETISLVDLSNESNSYTSTNGVFAHLPPGPYKFVSMERSCTGRPPITTLLTPSTFPETIQTSQIVYHAVATAKSLCGSVGVANVTASYKGQVIQQLDQFQFTPSGPNPLPQIPTCPFQLSLNLEPDDMDFIDLPTPSITIVTNPTCQESTDGILKIAYQGSPMIQTVWISLGTFDSPSSKAVDDQYTTGGGQVRIQVQMEGCPIRYKTTINVTPKTNFAIGLKKTPQKVNDCMVASGVVEVTNQDTFTTLLLDSVPSTNKIWTGLSSSKNHRFEFDTAACKGVFYFKLATEDIAFTTTTLDNTCGDDASIQLTASNGTYLYTDLTSDVITDNIGFLEASNTFTGVMDATPITTIFEYEACQWSYTFTPALRPNVESLFSFEIVQWPSCPTSSDGILRIVNNHNLNVDITQVDAEYQDLTLNGQLLYGWSIESNNQLLLAGSGQSTLTTISIALEWNDQCSGTYDFTYDLQQAPQYYPQYSQLNPNCAYIDAHIFFSTETLDTFDVNVDQDYVPISGFLYLPARPYPYVLNSYNRITKCSTTSPLTVFFDHPIVNFDQAVIKNESCPYESDGSIHIPPGARQSVNHLSLMPADQYNIFLSPSLIPYMPTFIGVDANNTFANLSSGTYLLSASNSNSPYCFEKQLITIGTFKPTVTTTITGNQCLANQLLFMSVTASITGTYSNVTYRLDNGVAQASGVFTNLPQGEHTISVEIHDDKCHQTLPPKSFTIGSSIITATLDTSVCNRLLVVSSSTNTSAVLSVTIENVSTLVLQSGSATFNSIAEGTYTATITDQSGCSLAKEATVTACDVSSSSTVQTTLFLVLSSIIVLAIL
eukprot:gene3483-3978_t